jgi:hypothetical protein
MNDKQTNGRKMKVSWLILDIKSRVYSTTYKSSNTNINSEKKIEMTLREKREYS